MKFLIAIDTSTPETMVAVGTPPPISNILISLKKSPKSHGPALLPLMHDALSEVGGRAKDLFAIGVGIGPGSFTGVRIGLSTAKTLAYAAKIPLIAVDWFEILAKPFNQEKIAVVLDAKRNELYYSTFKNGKRLTPPTLITQKDFFDTIKPNQGWMLVGPWVEANLENLIEIYLSNEIAPQEFHRLSPEKLFELVSEKALNNQFSKLDIEPLYLREPDAVINLRKKLQQEKKNV